MTFFDRGESWCNDLGSLPSHQQRVAVHELILIDSAVLAGRDMIVVRYDSPHHSIIS